MSKPLKSQQLVPWPAAEGGDAQRRPRRPRRAVGAVGGGGGAAEERVEDPAGGASLEQGPRLGEALERLEAQIDGL